MEFSLYRKPVVENEQCELKFGFTEVRLHKVCLSFTTLLGLLQVFYQEPFPLYPGESLLGASGNGMSCYPYHIWCLEWLSFISELILFARLQASHQEAASC